MPKRRAILSDSDENQPMRPALSPEARESQLVSLAFDAAEKQLRDGTASSQVITYFLKVASLREQKEIEKIELQKELLAAQKDNLDSTKRQEELFEKAIEAMRSYAPTGGGNDGS